jgi:hypothetical protein
MSTLPSVQKAKEFVQSLLPRAEKGDIAIIVSRSIQYTGIGEEYYQLVNFDKSLARGAPLGPDTPGGKAIIDALKRRHSR